MAMVHTGPVDLVFQLLHLLAGEPHSEGRLELHDDPDLPRCIIFTIESLGRILESELRLSAWGGSTAARLTHLQLFGDP